MKSASLDRVLRGAVLAVGVGCAGGVHAQSLPPPQAVDHGLFTGVQVYQPTDPAKQFVLLLSTADAPTADERALAKTLIGAGAMVAVVPWKPFYRKLVAQDGKCTYGAGALENLSRHIQAFDKLSSYLVPVVAGSGDAAALAYAVFAQAPASTFTSALSAGFCPRLVAKVPLCAANALRWQAAADGSGVDLQPAAALGGPWAATPAVASTAGCTPAAAQAFVQRVPQGIWIAPGAEPPSAVSARAFDRVATPQAALGPPPAQLADLPIVEVPVAAAVAAQSNRFAVMLSGDGGWAGIDKGIGAAFAAQGIPVAGFDSLRYFWSARTPEGLASDLDRVIRYYAARWKRSEVVLIGYSQGADVLPFAINRLPAGTRARIRSTALLGPGQNASFEFHVTNWIGPSGDRPIAPEARKLSASTTLCVYGVAEKDSLCPELAPRHARPLPLTGGHHFGGDYDALAARILETLPR